jgi:hypothetical protein
MNDKVPNPLLQYPPDTVELSQAQWKRPPPINELVPGALLLNPPTITDL